MVVVRELTRRAIHGDSSWRVELLLLLRLVMMRRMLLLLHSGCGWSSHVIRMVVVVMMGCHTSRGQVQVGCGHAGLRRHLTVHVLVNVIRVSRLLTARRSVVEVGLVVQRWWTIAMLLLLLVILARELSWEALLGISEYSFRSSWGGFL